MAFTDPVVASTASSGTIYGITIEQGKAFFLTTGARTAQPACSTMAGRWVFDASTAQGQAMLSALLTFYATGKPIEVTGTGDCLIWGDSETVSYIVQN